MSFYSRVIWITGTDTDVGKTVISSLLATGLRCDYWKPVQCGDLTNTDTQKVMRSSGLDSAYFHPERYRFGSPVSPHLAAKLENKQIRLSDFSLPTQSDSGSDTLIIEGAGGLLVPLNDKDFMVDLMASLGGSVILVSSSRVGTINHTLMSLNVLRSKGISPEGVVLNGHLNEENARAISFYGRVPVLAQIPFIDSLTPASLHQVWAGSGLSSYFDSKKEIRNA